MCKFLEAVSMCVLGVQERAVQNGDSIIWMTDMYVIWEAGSVSIVAGK
jgi:hypothetical protein